MKKKKRKNRKNIRMVGKKNPGYTGIFYFPK
jgi:hypothetical protein